MKASFLPFVNRQSRRVGGSIFAKRGGIVPLTT
jgi:hypothetical protein